MIMNLSDREAFLIYQMRKNPDDAEAIFRIARLPYDEQKLEAIKSERRMSIQDYYDKLKKHHVRIMNSIGKPVNIKTMNKYEKECMEKIAASDTYLDTLQKESTVRMQSWLKRRQWNNSKD